MVVENDAVINCLVDEWEGMKELEKNYKDNEDARQLIREKKQKILNRYKKITKSS